MNPSVRSKLTFRCFETGKMYGFYIVDQCGYFSCGFTFFLLIDLFRLQCARCWYIWSSLCRLIIAWAICTWWSCTFLWTLPHILDKMKSKIDKEKTNRYYLRGLFNWFSKIVKIIRKDEENVRKRCVHSHFNSIWHFWCAWEGGGGIRWNLLKFYCR